MSRSGSYRAAQAASVAALGVPGILLAHLLTTGVTAGPWTAAVVTLVVVAVAAVLPGRTATGLTGVTAATQLAGHAVLALATTVGAAATGCIPAVGRGATLGLRLALLRADGACPAGTLAPGPAAGVTAATVTAVLAAVTIVAGHALAAGLTGLLIITARRSVRTTRALRGRLSALVRLVGHLDLLLAAARRPVPDVVAAPQRQRDERALTPQFCPAAPRLRGPPPGIRRRPFLATPVPSPA